MPEQFSAGYQQRAFPVVNVGTKTIPSFSAVQPDPVKLLPAYLTGNELTDAPPDQELPVRIPFDVSHLTNAGEPVPAPVVFNTAAPIPPNRTGMATADLPALAQLDKSYATGQMLFPHVDETVLRSDPRGFRNENSFILWGMADIDRNVGYVMRSGRDRYEDRNAYPGSMLVELDPGTLEPKWAHRGYGAGFNSLAITPNGELLFVGLGFGTGVSSATDAGRTLVCHDNTGKIKWARHAGASLSLTADENALYVTGLLCGGGTARYSFDGVREWIVSEGGGSIWNAGNDVVVLAGTKAYSIEKLSGDVTNTLDGPASFTTKVGGAYIDGTIWSPFDHVYQNLPTKVTSQEMAVGQFGQQWNYVLDPNGVTVPNYTAFGWDFRGYTFTTPIVDDLVLDDGIHYLTAAGFVPGYPPSIPAQTGIWISPTHPGFCNTGGVLITSGLHLVPPRYGVDGQTIAPNFNGTAVRSAFGSQIGLQRTGAAYSTFAMHGDWPAGKLYAVGSPTAGDLQLLWDDIATRNVPVIE